MPSAADSSSVRSTRSADSALSTLPAASRLGTSLASHAAAPLSPSPSSRVESICTKPSCVSAAAELAATRALLKEANEKIGTHEASKQHMRGETLEKHIRTLIVVIDVMDERHASYKDRVGSLEGQRAQH